MSPVERSRRSRFRRRGRTPTRPTLSPRVLAALLGLVAFGLGAYLFTSYRSESDLRRANELGLAGNYAQAAVVAGTIRTGPAAARARAVAAYAYLAGGDLPAASSAFARAAAASPSEWTLRSAWATTLLRLGRRAKAQAEMKAALALDPQLTLPSGFCPAPGARRVVLCRAAASG